jgi:hypothetical protein
MPYLIRKVRGKNCYRVTNKQNKRILAKCSTKKNAKLQMKLLTAIHYNKNFVPNSNKTRKRNLTK